jgi:hypothetical protein
MTFRKSLQSGSDYAAALAMAHDTIAEGGGAIVKTVTDDEDGAHIVVRKGDGVRERFYFAGPVISKSVKPAKKHAGAAEVLGMIAFLTAHNDVMKAELAKLGKGSAMTDKPNNFMKCVAEIKARDGCSHTEAMSKARDEEPEAFAAFQGATPSVNEPALAKRQAQAKTVEKGRTFMTLASAIAKRDGCKHTVAMQRAREENPDAYAAWQNT